jgi:hypothetical protein
MLKEPKQVLRDPKVDIFQKYTYGISLIKYGCLGGEYCSSLTLLDKHVNTRSNAY